MSEENQARKRRGQPQQEKEQKSNNSNESKKSDRSKPFQGRYNPKASDRYGMLSHKTLAKFVMLMGAVVFVIYSGYNKQNIHTMAKVEEVLEKPRHAQFMCHPHYKQVSERWVVADFSCHTHITRLAKNAKKIITSTLYLFINLLTHLPSTGDPAAEPRVFARAVWSLHLRLPGDCN